MATKRAVPEATARKRGSANQSASKRFDTLANEQPSHAAPPSRIPEQERRAAVSRGLASEFRGSLSVDGMRILFAQMTTILNQPLPPIGKTVSRVALTDHGSPATVDVLVPKGEGPHPVLVYLHGGAWVAGSPDSHRKLTHRFVEAGYLVVSVDYRLAPEHPFPRGFDDCVAAVHWTAQRIAEYGGDAARLAIGGDSAGANLAAAVATHLRGRSGAPHISAALLIYGIYDFNDLGGATATRMLQQAYFDQKALPDVQDPRLSPITAADELPPSYILIGTQDALLANSRRLREAMEGAGVRHDYHEVSGAPHGFVQMEFVPGWRRSIKGMTNFLDRELAQTPETLLRRWRMKLAQRIWHAPLRALRHSTGPHQLRR